MKPEATYLLRRAACRVVSFVPNFQSSGGGGGGGGGRHPTAGPPTQLVSGGPEWSFNQLPFQHPTSPPYRCETHLI